MASIRAIGDNDTPVDETRIQRRRQHFGRRPSQGLQLQPVLRALRHELDAGRACGRRGDRATQPAQRPRQTPTAVDGTGEPPVAALSVQGTASSLPSLCTVTRKSYLSPWLSWATAVNAPAWTKPGSMSGLNQGAAVGPSETRKLTGTGLLLIREGTPGQGQHRERAPIRPPRISSGSRRSRCGGIVPV